MEIKEFYGTGSAGTADSASKSVEEQFKNMLQSSECDSLVVSGHHTGYFVGEQSIDKRSGSQTLDLDFMEEMSCEEGCDKWFSNVKSLFLMGCQTVKTPSRLENDSDSPDSETIRIAAGNPVEKGYIHKIINQAYSSTLDKNNKLSHRYLRMFPNSSLYGWGEKSPSTGSEHSLPNFINLVGSFQQEESRDSAWTELKPEKSAERTDNILKFITFMNQQHQRRNCFTSIKVADEWAWHWISIDERNLRIGEITEGEKFEKARKQTLGKKGTFDTTQATACFLKEKDRTQFIEHQKLGCALTEALKSNNGGNIKTAIQNILNSGPDGIRVNFNRLMSLITNRKNKKHSWYSEVVGQLRDNGDLKSALLAEIDPPPPPDLDDVKPNKVGFVRKSDYLYFYREMGWGDKNEHQRISTAFLIQMQTAFDEIAKPIEVKDEGTGKYEEMSVKEEVKGAHRWAVFNSIAQNGLGKWLHQNNEEEFENLQKKFTGSTGKWDPMYGHYLTYLGDPTSEEVETSDRFLVDFMNARSKLNKRYITEELCNNYGVSNSKEFVCQ